MPKKRLSYWEPKLLANKARDKKFIGALKRQGWKSLVIWECQLAQMESIIKKVENFLKDIK